MKRHVMKLVALCAALMVTMAVAAPAFAAESVPSGSISVNGVGTVKADPDIANANVGVEITAKTPAEAQDQVAEIIDKIVNALKELGVKDNDIKTASYYMYKQYDYTRYYDSMATSESSEPEVIGYSVVHTLSVTIRDLDKVGEILEASVEAGANQTNNVNFSIEDQEGLYIQALELAMKNAQIKAEAIAKSMKVQIGAPLYVSETSYGYVYPIYMDGAAFANISGSVAREEGEKYGVSMQTGKVEVTANVSISYDYDR